MSETTEKLVGIKQVLLPEFKAAEKAGTTKGYMWFVRDNNITLHNYIYLGSRLYGEAEIEVPFDSVITNILSDNSIVVTKTSSEEGTTVELKINLDPNGGLTLTENGLQVDMSKFISQSELDKVKDDIKTVNDNLVTSINTINQNVADGFNTINGGIENEIKPAIAEAKKLAVDETERALIAETNLQTNINVETTERKIDVANLQGNINIETERALAAEAALAEKVKEVDVDEIKADIKTVNDNLVTAVNTINQNMADGEKVTKVNIGELVDTYEAGNGLELNGNIFSIKLDPSSQSYIQVTSDGIKIIAIDEAISEINGKITAEETRASGVEAKLRTDVDYEHERALEAEANINNALETKVTWDESKSKIVLPSGGQIVGTKYGTDGSNPADGATIAQLSQYDIMDFGSSKYPLNLNVPAGVRVTVQEQGQSGENANKVAYLSDVEVKVDKVEGKGLSEEDFTTALKTKLEGLNNYNDTDIKNDIASLDTAYKTADTALEEKITANEQAIATKVDKVDGMGLSQESFTTALKTKLEGLNNYDDTVIKTSVEENKTNIAGVRSDLTAETTLQATNYNDLNTRLNSEVTRATDRENEIETKINNILSTGLTLPNNESISARPTGSTTSPVNILTLTSGNVVEVGSNIGNLSLKSKSSPVISINDGVAKEIALKEQIDALQTLIDDLTSRVEALEAKNP